MTTIATIRARQGFAPPETEAEHAEYERLKVERRQQNVVNAREILARNGIEWYERGEGFMVEDPVRKRTVAYVPETGRWFDGNGWRFGCRNLVKYLKGKVV